MTTQIEVKNLIQTTLEPLLAEVNAPYQGGFPLGSPVEVYNAYTLSVDEALEGLIYHHTGDEVSYLRRWRDQVAFEAMLKEVA